MLSVRQSSTAIASRQLPGWSVRPSVGDLACRVAPHCRSLWLQAGCVRQQLCQPWCPVHINTPAHAYRSNTHARAFERVQQPFHAAVHIGRSIRPVQGLSSTAYRATVRLQGGAQALRCGNSQGQPPSCSTALGSREATQTMYQMSCRFTAYWTMGARIRIQCSQQPTLHTRPEASA
jgi:hypothetical protein